MNTRTSIAMALAAVLAVAIVPATLQKAFAHAHTEMDVPASEHLADKKVSFVLGHTAEPAFGAEPGIHDGIHNMEILLSDSATKLPLTGAALKADKYYFKDMTSFNNASSVNDADETLKNVTVSSVFGDPGHYMVRQVQAPGIYGYHVYGTIDYFKVAQIPVNTTVFCRDEEGDTSKFNSPGWTGAFGCADDINDIAFPKDAISGKDDNGQGNDHKATVKTSYGNSSQRSEAQMTVPVTYGDAAGGQSDAVASANAVAKSPMENTGLAQILAIGIPMTAAAGVFGWRSRRKSKNED